MCFDVENSWMQKEKVLEMSHEGFFKSRTEKESIFWKFSWMLFFKNISNANLLDVFYK